MLSKILGGLKPDITPAQIVSGVPILAELLHAFGVYDLSAAQQDSLAKSATWALALLAGDTVLRAARNHANAKVEAAALTPVPAPAQPMAGAPVEPQPGPADPAAPPAGPTEAELRVEEADLLREESDVVDVEEFAAPPLLPGEDAERIGANAGNPPKVEVA